MKTLERKSIINSMECMRNRGEFDGFEEENTDFNLCDDEELSYYRDNWIENQDMGYESDE